MFSYLGERERKGSRKYLSAKKNQSTPIRLAIIWGEYKRSLQTGLLRKNLKKRKRD